MYLQTHVQTHVVSENTPFSAKALLILLMSAFFCKKSVSYLISIKKVIPLLKAIVRDLC